MATEPSRDGRSGFVAGLLIGLFLGLLAVALLPIALALVPLGMLASARALREVPIDRPLSAGIAGYLLGIGAVLMFGALNTFVACTGSEDFCGNANIVPLFAFAFFTLMCGALASVLTVVRSKSQHRLG
jgi:hypothetical protein